MTELDNKFRHIPTNLSVNNCKISRLYDYMHEIPFDYDVEPSSTKSGIKFLNKDVFKYRSAPDFFKTTCSGGFCPKEQWGSYDPRLIDPMRGGNTMTFSEPPIQSNIDNLSEINDVHLDEFGKTYKTYSDINAGNIRYWTDNSRHEPFYNPVFVNPAYVESTVLKDPMGAMRPQYHRYPIGTRNPINTSNTNFRHCLSWMDDSIEHREDIMARQNRKNDEKDWSYRWK